MVSATKSPAEGDRIGRFRLLRRVGVGGMAEIFRAVDDLEPQGHVAVKVLLPEYCDDDELLRMFEHEAKLQSRFSHPNLVRVREISTAGPVPYLVMDYVDGAPLSDLSRWLRKERRTLDPCLALHIADRVLCALEYVHEATGDDGAPLSIVHRDVTPHNVLISAAGEVLLGDFGIARSRIRDGRTRTGVIRGKLRFLSPEQVTGSAVDARTDLYALGLIVFELVAAAPFLVADNELDLLREAEAPQWRAPSGVAAADVNPRIDALLERALRRFPEERYPSAAAFRRAVEETARAIGCRAGASELGALVREAMAAGPARRQAPVATVADGQRAIEPGAGRGPPQARADAGRARRVRSPGAWVTAMVGVLAVGGVFELLWRARAPDQSTSTRPAPRELDPAPTIAWAPSSGAADSVAVGVTAAAAVAETGAAGGAAVGALTSARSGRDSASSARASVSAPRASADALGAAAAPGESAPSSSSAPIDDRAEEIRQQIVALVEALGRRGIVPSDLEEGDRAILRRAQQDVAAGDLGSARVALSTLRPRVIALQVDGAFVKRKLDRTSAAIRRAEQRGEDAAVLRELSATALQDYMAGRYEATNQRLNEILARLGR